MKKRSKKALSEMISYVILISITVALSITAYAYLRTIAKPPIPIDCEPETSMILTSYNISDDLSKMEITMKNNGRFNINGYILTVSDNVSREPTILLVRRGFPSTLAGQEYFLSPLKPNEETRMPAIFEDEDQNNNFINLSKIRTVQVQPFIVVNNKRIICINAVIKEDI